MPVTVVSGNHVRGAAVSDNENDTQAFIAEKRQNGAKVTLKRKYETFLGSRFEVDPPVHKIKWSY